MVKQVRKKKPGVFRFLRFWWRKSIHVIKNLRGEPEQIAWGGAIGVFISVTPTFGIQTVLAFFVATIFKANRIAAVAAVYITNVFTVIPAYFFTGWIGISILSRDVHQESFYTGLKLAFSDLGNGHYREAYHFFWKYFLALWVGAVVVGVIGGALTFVILYYMSKSYYKIRRKRKELRALKRQEERSTPNFQHPTSREQLSAEKEENKSVAQGFSPGKEKKKGEESKVESHRSKTEEGDRAPDEEIYNEERETRNAEKDV